MWERIISVFSSPGSDDSKSTLLDSAPSPEMAQICLSISCVMYPFTGILSVSVTEGNRA